MKKHVHAQKKDLITIEGIHSLPFPSIVIG